MSRYLLDTDTCVSALRGRRPVLDRLQSLSPGDVCISSMTEAELGYGVLASRDREGNASRTRLLLEPMEILAFDSDAAQTHARIRWAVRKLPIGERDLVIASVAVARGLTLVTGNRREFRRVPDLALESWLT